MAVTFKGQYASVLTSGDFNVRGTAGWTSNNGIFVAESDDSGLNWNPAVTVLSHLYDGQDPVFFECIPDLAIDTFGNLPSGQPNPNFGNMYVTWTRLYPIGQFPGGGPKDTGTDIMVAVSKDHGQTFVTQLEDPSQVPATLPEHFATSPVTVIQDVQNGLGGGTSGQGYLDHTHLSVGPEGDVYLTYYAGGDFAVDHSTDAAASFAIPDYINPPDGSPALRLPFGNAFDTNPPFAGLGKGNQFRLFPIREIDADPMRPGYVYATATKLITAPSGNLLDASDVLFARSTDYGVHWQSTLDIGTTITKASVLNDDNGGHSADGQASDVASGQALPRMSIDTQGNISLIWYDTRHDPASRLLDVFGSTSTDGGLTFSPNYRVTDRSFDASQGAFSNPTDQQLGGP